jgi:hypothetical protein
VGSELPLLIAARPVMLTSTMIMQVWKNEAKVGSEASTASTNRSPPPRSGTCAKAGAYGSTSSAPWTSPAPTASPSTASPGPNTASNLSPAQPRSSPPSPRSPAARHALSSSDQPTPATTPTGLGCSSGPSGKACGESCVSLTSGRQHLRCADHLTRYLDHDGGVDRGGVAMTL